VVCSPRIVIGRCTVALPCPHRSAAGTAAGSCQTSAGRRYAPHRAARRGLVLHRPRDRRAVAVDACRARRLPRGHSLYRSRLRAASFVQTSFLSSCYFVRGASARELLPCSMSTAPRRPSGATTTRQSPRASPWPLARYGRCAHTLSPLSAGQTPARAAHVARRQARQSRSSPLRVRPGRALVRCCLGSARTAARGRRRGTGRHGGASTSPSSLDAAPPSAGRNNPLYSILHLTAPGRPVASLVPPPQGLSPNERPRLGGGVEPGSSYVKNELAHLSLSGNRKPLNSQYISTSRYILTVQENSGRSARHRRRPGSHRPVKPGAPLRDGLGRVHGLTVRTRQTTCTCR
jgi:hypothetical protein